MQKREPGVFVSSPPLGMGISQVNCFLTAQFKRVVRADVGKMVLSDIECLFYISKACVFLPNGCWLPVCCDAKCQAGSY